VQSAIPPALAGALQDVSGFAGCLVMISEQEARLVTVITLWVGNDRLKQCRENANGVHKLLAPYVDRCLRVQILAAYLPELAVPRHPVVAPRSRPPSGKHPLFLDVH
jgi:hypothetical protein